jgi:Leucine-rich repeat (LRR) protein
MKNIFLLFFLIISLFCSTLFAKEINFDDYARNDTLSLMELDVSDADVPSLLNYLARHSEINILDLSYNYALTDKGYINLAKMDFISSLTLRNNKLDGEGVSALLNNKKLKSLNLLYSKFNKDVVAALAKNTTLSSLQISLDTDKTLDDIEMLANNGTLIHLELVNTGSLDWSDHVEIGKFFENNPSLTTLSIAGFQLGDGAKYLANNTHFTELNLYFSKISDEGAIALAKNGSLKKLGLAFNWVGEKGIIALANSSSLQDLDLTQSHITEAAAYALAKSNLSTLIIWCNLCNLNPLMMGDVGAIAFANTAHIDSLVIANENITDTGAVALAKNTTLKTLVLAQNAIGDEGAIALAHNNNITQLNLWDNTIGSAGVIALSANTTLETLILSGNRIGYEGAAALAKNTTLSYLNVSDTHMPEEGMRVLGQNHSIKCIVFYDRCNDNDVDLTKATSHRHKKRQVI